MSTLRHLVKPLGFARFGQVALMKRGLASSQSLLNETAEYRDRLAALRSTVERVEELKERPYQLPVLEPLPPDSPAFTYVREGFFGGYVKAMMAEKLGQTGSLSLGVGVFLTLVSKEYYILNIESSLAFLMILTYAPICIIISPHIQNYFHSARDNFYRHLYNMKRRVLRGLDSGVKAMDSVEEQASVRKDIFDILRTNAALHREALYRARLSKAHEEIVKRLEHQAELEAARRRNVQDHMVRWVEREVTANITPELEKKIIDQCIADLKSVKALA